MEKATGSKRRKTKKRTASAKGASKKINPKRLLVFGLALIAVVYFVYVMISQQISISQKDKEISALEQKISDANQETEQLKQELEYLNDPKYLESAAREKLGLVRPNERIFVDANKSDANNGN